MGAWETPRAPPPLWDRPSLCFPACGKDRRPSRHWKSAAGAEGYGENTTGEACVRACVLCGRKALPPAPRPCGVSETLPDIRPLPH